MQYNCAVHKIIRAFLENTNSEHTEAMNSNGAQLGGCVLASLVRVASW